MIELKKRWDLECDLSTLRPHPDNKKLHDDEEMDESLDGTGFSGAIVAQEGTNYVLDGHGRLDGLRRKGVTHEAVQFLDVDDALARKILLSRNKVGSEAGFDEEGLAALLLEMAEEGQLEGTGYDADDLDDLVASFDGGITEVEDFTGDFVEQEAETEKRAERKAVTKAATGLREVVLVYRDEDYETLRRALAYVGEFHAAQSTSEAVLSGIVAYAKMLEQDANPVVTT